MSKRKNQSSPESTPAAKKISENNESQTEEKMFAYYQRRIDVTSLFLTTKFADVHFVFDSDDGAVTRIPAHKNLLVVTSNIFEKMFCGELKENGDIKIVDASEAAFKEFLQFFYLNDVNLSAENVESVLYLGNKYNVESCIDACVEFMTDDLSNENVCASLSLAIFHDQKELTQSSEKHITLNTTDVFKSAGFLESSKEVLAHILKMNLFSCSEVNVFEACMEWIRAKSQQQVLSKAMVEEHLGDLYYQIRFASMTIEEFLALKTKYNAVLSSDFEAIIRIVTQKDTDMDTHPDHFNALPRQVKWNGDRDAIVKCDRDDDDESVVNWHALDIEEKTTFSISEPLVLGEFICNVLRVGESNRKILRTDLSVEVKVTEVRTLDDTNDVKVLCSMPANVGSQYVTVSLPHPILIRPEFFYTISIKGFPDDHYYISYDFKGSMTLESDINVEFHNDKVVNGKTVGLIWKLRFNKI